MEVSSFLVLLCMPSRPPNFRQFMLERVPEVQETIDPETRPSVKWDVLPGFHLPSRLESLSHLASEADPNKA